MSALAQPLGKPDQLIVIGDVPPVMVAVKEIDCPRSATDRSTWSVTGPNVAPTRSLTGPEESATPAESVAWTVMLNDPLPEGTQAIAEELREEQPGGSPSHWKENGLVPFDAVILSWVDWPTSRFRGDALRADSEGSTATTTRTVEFSEPP
jgi:hypothetical protein